MRTNLILDGGGVLWRPLPESFWRITARLNKTYPHEAVARYRKEARIGLWRGHFTEKDFWNWYKKTYPGWFWKDARDHILAGAAPLEGMPLLSEWSKKANIFLLSNQIRPWVEHLLQVIEPYVQDVILSSEVGYVKPDHQIYELLAQRMPDGPVIFVDDKHSNLLGAHEAGFTDWQLVEPHPGWTQAVQASL